MSGSRPLPEEVTKSTGMGAVLFGSTAFKALILDWTSVIKAGLEGPRFEPEEAEALYGKGAVADSLPQK
jgi:hypothetical protein